MKQYEQHIKILEQLKNESLGSEYAIYNYMAMGLRTLNCTKMNETQLRELFTCLVDSAMKMTQRVEESFENTLSKFSE